MNAHLASAGGVHHLVVVGQLESGEDHLPAVRTLTATTTTTAPLDVLQQTHLKTLEEGRRATQAADDGRTGQTKVQHAGPVIEDGGTQEEALHGGGGHLRQISGHHLRDQVRVQWKVGYKGGKDEVSGKAAVQVVDGAHQTTMLANEQIADGDGDGGRRQGLGLINPSRPTDSFPPSQENALQ